MDAIRIIAVRLRLVVAIVAIVGCAGAFSRAQVKVNVTTWHNDNLRTGQNTNETTLTKSLVGNPTGFGKICSTGWPVLDSWAYAQPLVVSNVRFTGQSSPTTVAGGPPLRLRFKAHNCEFRNSLVLAKVGTHAACVASLILALPC
jgi:hypothetical protein